MTKRTSIACGLAFALSASPALAAKDPDKDKGGKDKPTTAYCVPKSVGFKASGVLVSHTVTQTAGADTAKRSDDRYSGEVTVDVKKANHKGLKGEQTYTLANARVKFHPRNDTDVAAGDRVKLSGKITKTGKKCAEGATVTVTVKKVDVKAAKTPKA